MTAGLPDALDERAAALSDVLESVLAGWVEERLPPADAMRLVRDACHELSLFRDAGLGVPDPLTPVDRAARAIEAARGHAPQVDHETLGELLAELGELRRRALDRLGAEAASPPSRPVTLATGLELVASVGQPAVRRGVVLPPLSLVRPPIEIEDLLAEATRRDPVAEDEDEREEDLAPVVGPTDGATLQERRADPSYAHLHAVARDLMEDLGMLQALRRPLPDERWVGPERFEARVLAQLDALFSLTLATDPFEPVYALIEELHAYATEWAAPDRGRAFALALPLACIDGDAAARWLLAALRRSHPYTHPAFVDALALGASPRLGRAIGAALSGTEPSAVLIALLEAAERRRDVGASSLVLCLDHPEPAVVCAAARALARADRAVAQAVLSDLLARQGPAALVAAELLAGMGEQHGFATLRGWLEVDLASSPGHRDPLRVGTALRALACLGAREDESLVLRAALELEGGLRWLGTYGHAPHAATLYEIAEDPARGADARQGLAVLLGDAFRGVEDETSGDAELRASVEADRAARREEAASASVRWRGGGPHRGVVTLLAELLDPAARRDDRAAVVYELGMATRSVVPLDPSDWISRQRADIDALRAAAGAG